MAKQKEITDTFVAHAKIMAACLIIEDTDLFVPTQKNTDMEANQGHVISQLFLAVLTGRNQNVILVHLHNLVDKGFLTLHEEKSSRAPLNMVDNRRCNNAANVYDINYGPLLSAYMSLCEKHGYDAEKLLEDTKYRLTNLSNYKELLHIDTVGASLYSFLKSINDTKAYKMYQEMAKDEHALFSEADKLRKEMNVQDMTKYDYVHYIFNTKAPSLKKKERVFKKTILAYIKKRNEEYASIMHPSWKTIKQLTVSIQKAEDEKERRRKAREEKRKKTAEDMNSSIHEACPDIEQAEQVINSLLPEEDRHSFTAEGKLRDVSRIAKYKNPKHDKNNLRIKHLQGYIKSRPINLEHKDIDDTMHQLPLDTLVQWFSSTHNGFKPVIEEDTRKGGTSLAVYQDFCMQYRHSLGQIISTPDMEEAENERFFAFLKEKAMNDKLAMRTDAGNTIIEKDIHSSVLSKLYAINQYKFNASEDTDIYLSFLEPISAVMPKKYNTCKDIPTVRTDIKKIVQSMVMSGNKHIAYKNEKISQIYQARFTLNHEANTCNYYEVNDILVSFGIPADYDKKARIELAQKILPAIYDYYEKESGNNKYKGLFFIVESMIHITFKAMLLQKYDVLVDNVYDGFYLTQDDYDFITEKGFYDTYNDAVRHVVYALPAFDAALKARGYKLANK